jgi:predicted dehydrogenase
MKIAVIGCGYWGPNLVRNFSVLPDCDGVVCFDTDENKLVRVKRTYQGVVTTTRLDDVLEDPEIKAVAIATPVVTHFELASRCLLSGKHVLVEKPMAASSRECLELAQLAGHANLTLMVGHTFEYSVVVNKMKEIIASGELGEILYLNFQRLNLGPYRSDVNVVWDLAAHDVSILQFLLDQAPKGVNAQAQAFLKKDNEDVATATLHFADGVVAFINDSWLDPHKVRRGTVVGSRKMLVYDDTSMQEKIKIFDKGIDAPAQYSTFGEFHFSYRYGDIYTPRIDEQEPLRVECQHFLDCIRGDSAVRSDGWSGTRVVRVLEAITKSIRQNGGYVPITYEQDQRHVARKSGSVGRDRRRPRRTPTHQYT